MPTYEYACNKCRKHHDVFQSITAKPLTKCPDKKCGGRVTRLLGHGGTILFKGSGFYITDYRKKGYNEAKKKDESATSESSKPDSKPSGGSCADKGGSCGKSQCDAD